MTVENSTIANNASTCDFGGCSGGGGIYTNSAPVSINSSTLSNNTSRTGGNIISLYNGAKTCDLVPATIALFQTTGTVVGPVTLSTYTLAADSGSDFKVDATACQYVYNLSTASLGSGTYSVKILIGGTIVGAATFGMQ